MARLANNFAPFLLVLFSSAACTAETGYRQHKDYGHVYVTPGWQVVKSSDGRRTINYWTDDDGSPKTAATYAVYRAAEVAKEEGYKGFTILGLSDPDRNVAAIREPFYPEQLPDSFFTTTRYHLVVDLVNELPFESGGWFYDAEETLKRLDPVVKKSTFRNPLEVILGWISPD